MLREYTSLKQEPGPGVRRWFESDGMDLIVWCDESGTREGFQLCYDLGSGEHALTWRVRQGWSHDRIDGGDRTPFANEAPILVPARGVPWRELAREFRNRSECLEPDLRDWIANLLAKRGGLGPRDDEVR